MDYLESQQKLLEALSSYVERNNSVIESFAQVGKISDKLTEQLIKPYQVCFDLAKALQPPQNSIIAFSSAFKTAFEKMNNDLINRHICLPSQYSNS